jgi:hypothetical protein
MMLIRLFKAAYRNKALVPTTFHLTAAEADLLQFDNPVEPHCVLGTLLITCTNLFQVDGMTLAHEHLGKLRELRLFCRHCKTYEVKLGVSL